VNGYTIQGNMDLESKVTGELGNGMVPLITISYEASEASILHDSTKFSFDDISLKGSYISRTSMKEFTASSRTGELIKVSSYSLLSNGDLLEGTLSLADFSDPVLHFTTAGSLDLQRMHEANYLGLDTLYSLTGEIGVEASFASRVKYLSDIKRRDIRKMKLSGTIELKEVVIRMREETPDIILERGTITLNDNDIFIENLSAKMKNSDMILEGYLKNILSFVFLDSEKLFVDAEITSDEINMDELLKDYHSSSSSDTSYALRFPDQVNANIKLSIGELRFRRFKGNDISGVVMLKNKKLIAKELVFDAMGGTVSALGVIDGTRSYIILISCDSDIKGIHITKLFFW